MIENVAPQEITSWRSRLDEVFSTMAGLFGRVELRRRARSYLVGLLAPLERKTGWQLAAAAGDPTPVRVQHFLSRAVWSADLVRDALRAYAAANLAGPGGALVVDETGFLKRGRASAGVQRQYLHATGRTENCQVGVFLAYVGERGAALIDRELHLPPPWIEDPDRCTAAGVPASRIAEGTLAKPRLAEAMIGRAVAAGVVAGWVAADATYGRDSAFLSFLTARRLPYVVEVPLTQTLRESDRVDVLASGAPESAWRRVPPRPDNRVAGEYDWAWATLPGTDDLPPGFVRTLLVRRSTERPAEFVYFLCFHADGVRREEIVRTAEARAVMAACLLAAKTECGLDHYQVRRWEGWYRHVTLAMLAHAFLAVTAAAERTAGEVGGPEAPRAIRWR
jgi:SRSO17 transposase